MRYTEIAKASPFEGAPKINTPKVFGASPKKPLLIKIAVTGKRPITYGAEGLPEGLSLDGSSVKGSVLKRGVYKIKLSAENELGRDEMLLTLEIKAVSMLGGITAAGCDCAAP